MRKDIRLIALDLDGTLFNSKSEVSEKNKDVLKKAIASGIQVIISTGRPFVGLPMDVVKELNIQYAITANGAAVYHIPDRKCIFSNCMEQAIIGEKLEEISKLPLHLDAFIDGNGYTQSSMQRVIDNLNIKTPMKKYIKNTRTAVDNIAAFVKNSPSPVQKITINFPPEEGGTMNTRKKAFEILSADSYFKLVSGGFNNLEVTRAGVSKAIGLKCICDALGIDIASSMACGDSENDLEDRKSVV